MHRAYAPKTGSCGTTPFLECACVRFMVRGALYVLCLCACDRARERANEAAAQQAEIEHTKEWAKVNAADKYRMAEQHRLELRARANKYRKDKELAKTSAFAR